MKRNFKKLFLLLAVVITALVCFAFSASANDIPSSGKCGDNVSYTYNSTTKELVISGEGEMWDYGWNGSPFFWSNIKSVVINEGVTTIGDSAFRCCDSLTEVTIGDSVTTIGDKAFYYCDSLTDITVDEKNQYFSNDEYGVLFNKDKTTLIQYPNGNKRTSYTIPDSVTTIGDYAFYSCDSLTEVTIPDSVTTIGEGAFAWCDSLTEVTIGDSVTTIDSDAFYNTGYYDNASNWEDDVLYIGEYLIKAKDTLSGSYEIKDGTKVIADSASCYCYSLTEVTIPDSVTTIGEGAFAWCDSLTEVTIGDSVTTIGDYAFSDCYSLTDVYYGGTQEQWNKIKIGSWDNSDLTGANIHYTCYHINKTTYAQQSPTCTANGYTAGEYCPDCKKWLSGHEVILAKGHTDTDSDKYCDICKNYTEKLVSSGKCGDNVTYEWYEDGMVIISGTGPMTDYENFNGSPFYNSSIKSVMINEGVTTISDDAFSYCDSLTEVTIPDSVTTIGDWAFSYCDSLTEVTIPDSVTTIGDWAFEYCDSLTEVTIGDSVKTIGDYAFYLCYSLTEVTIPDSVITIGNNAFAWCESLTEVTIPDSVTTIGYYAFRDCDSLMEVTIGDGVTTIGSEAFYDCDSLEKVIIGDSVTTIGASAFYECYSLTDVYYGGTQEQWKKISIGSLNDDLTGANIHYTCYHKNKTTHAQQNSTCIKAGYTAGTYCPSCKKWISGHKKIEKLPHSYTKYTSNKDASLLADGTKTALCDYGCGNKKTVTDKGSKLTLGKASKLTATPTNSSITLTWSKGKNATGYRLYYKLEGDINWRECVSYTTKTTYTFKNLSAGTLYTFAVKSVGKVGSSTVYGSYVTVATATKPLKPVKIISSQNTSAIKLTWSASKGADGYRVYYKSGSEWKTKVSSTAVTTYTFKGLKAGTKYTFAVKPYIKTADGVIWGEYTQFTTATAPANPTLKVTAPSKGKLTVNWKAVTGAESYQLWYKTGNGSYKLYKTYSSAKTLNFKNLKSGTKYTFAVRAVIKTSGGNVRSGYKAVSATVK